MSRGQQTPLDRMFVFDLESCDDDLTLELDVPHQRAWLSGFMNVATGELSTFTDLKECLTSLFSKGGNQNIEVGVHNLAFDGSFIIPQLVQMGFEPTEGKPRVNEFSVLISDRNLWYSIQVRVTKKRKVTFWDTLKLFPMPLSELHNVYNTKTQKLKEGDDFYNQIRTRDHIVTEDENKYFYNDLKVLQEVITAHVGYEGLGFKKTQASQAFYNFTQSFKAWRLRFPPLSTDVDQTIRKAYLGGISYVNPRYQGLLMVEIQSYDINSSYPFELSDKPFPYGDIISVSSGDHPLMGQFWVTRAVVEFKLKPNKLPCIATKQIAQKPLEMVGDSMKWAVDSYGLVDMTFSSIDYLTYTESYDFKVIEWVKTYHWAQKRHKEIKDFILQNNDDKIKYRALSKTTNDPNLKNEYLAKAQRAKINNNGFYGKFGEEIVKIGKNVELDALGGVKYVESREEVLTPYKRKYLPVAIATTAYARAHLVLMVNILGSDFIYCDTDSVYFKKDGLFKLYKAVKEKQIKLDPLELGAWSDEGEFKKGIFLRPKTYIVENVDGENEVTCAGLPADKSAPYGSKSRSCLTFDNFEIGTIIKGGNGKLRPILTPTGKKLVPVDFELGGNKIFGF